MKTIIGAILVTLSLATIIVVPYAIGYTIFKKKQFDVSHYWLAGFFLLFVLGTIIAVGAEIGKQL